MLQIYWENTDMYCKKKKEIERGGNKKGGAEISPFSPFLQMHINHLHLIFNAL